MREIKPIKLTKENFAPYGKYVNLKVGERNRRGDDWECWATLNPPMNVLMDLGMTKSLSSGTFLSDSMERHLATEEVLFVGNKPNVLCIANSDPDGNPMEDDVVAFYMDVGDLVVLNKGIWHDANHGIEEDTYYYYLASSESDDPREIEFIDVKPEPVKVIID